MVPESIDAVALLDALNVAGWPDYKIEGACKFSKGYIAQIRCGNVKMMGYDKAARLLNFHASNVPHETLSIQPLVVADDTNTIDSQGTA